MIRHQAIGKKGAMGKQFFLDFANKKMVISSRKENFLLLIASIVDMIDTIFIKFHGGKVAVFNLI